MTRMQSFMKLLTGRFSNKEQYEAMQKAGKPFPYAEHVNTICNDKISGLPEGFRGAFLVEESYYEMNGKRHASPHLFLFTEENDGILLTSYEIPEGNDKASFSYDTMKQAEFGALKVSEKFTPALYREHDGVFEGGSTSMFTPVLKFELYERFSEDCLEVSETMEMNGKRTFGFDEPIIYKRM